MVFVNHHTSKYLVNDHYYTCRGPRARDRSINRYYDPSTDQFISVDPMVDTTGQPYVFVNDNPLNATDPIGLCFLGLCHVVNAVKDVGKVAVKVGKAALNNSLVRGVMIGIAITVACGATAVIGCALLVGGVTGAALSLANHKVNHTKGDWQSAVVIGGLQGMTNGVTGGIWSELSRGEASSASEFFARSVPGTIMVKAITTRIFGR